MAVGWACCFSCGLRCAVFKQAKMEHETVTCPSSHLWACVGSSAFTALERAQPVALREGWHPNLSLKSIFSTSLLIVEKKKKKKQSVLGGEKSRKDRFVYVTFYTTQNSSNSLRGLNPTLSWAWGGGYRVAPPVASAAHGCWPARRGAGGGTQRPLRTTKFT